MLTTVRNARTMLDCGYTSAFSAASAKPRLDVVLRREIEAGRVPGPAAARQWPRDHRDGRARRHESRCTCPTDEAPTFCWVANGPDEIRRVRRARSRARASTS